MDPNEIKVTNHPRLEAKFQEDFPVGPYRAYYHPGKVKLGMKNCSKKLRCFLRSQSKQGSTDSSTTVLLLPSCRTTGLSCLVKLDWKLFILLTVMDSQEQLTRRPSPFSKSHLIAIPTMNPLWFTPSTLVATKLFPFGPHTLKTFAVRNLTGTFFRKLFLKPPMKLILMKLFPSREEIGWYNFDLSEDPRIKPTLRTELL